MSDFVCYTGDWFWTLLPDNGYHCPISDATVTFLTLASDFGLLFIAFGHNCPILSTSVQFWIPLSHFGRYSQFLYTIFRFWTPLHEFGHFIVRFWTTYSKFEHCCPVVDTIVRFGQNSVSGPSIFNDGFVNELFLILKLWCPFFLYIFFFSFSLILSFFTTKKRSITSARISVLAVQTRPGL